MSEHRKLLASLLSELPKKPTYRELASVLLGKRLDPPPFGSPSEYLDEDGNLLCQNPGDLTHRDDGQVCARVCRLVQGMTAEQWAKLGASERIGWMQEAVAKLGLEAGKQTTDESKPNNPFLKKNVNAQMLDKMQQDTEDGSRECHGWTCKQWAKHLRCSTPSVVATKTWRMLREYREKLKAERALIRNRHRRAKGSDQRKGADQD